MNDSLQFYSTNIFFSTISETWFHFSTNSISLQFLKIVFIFSTISETCFHLSTISETYFHLSTISISLQFWCDPTYLQFTYDCLSLIASVRFNISDMDLPNMILFPHPTSYFWLFLELALWGDRMVNYWLNWHAEVGKYLLQPRLSFILGWKNFWKPNHVFLINAFSQDFLWNSII